ncbi:MAG TPA: hypothetical protein VGP47_08110 [Parachlamydiaceae bacterium]|nr:hypothetical protein [Parachlamydiaceae bacterium]
MDILINNAGAFPTGAGWRANPKIGLDLSVQYQRCFNGTHDTGLLAPNEDSWGRIIQIASVAYNTSHRTAGLWRHQSG